MTTNEVVGMIIEDIEALDNDVINKIEQIGNVIVIQFPDGSAFEVEVNMLPDNKTK